MTIRAVSFLFAVVAAAAIFVRPTASVDPEAGPATPAGDDGGQAIVMQHVESRTTSITVNWTVNSTAAASSSSSAARYDFQVVALSLNSGIVLVARPTNETEFTLTDLTVDTPYKICVVAAAAAAAGMASRSSAVAAALEDIDAEDRDRSGAARRSCLLVGTIAYVRLDSIMVFLGVVAFVAVSIATAVFCWKRSQVEEPGSTAATTTDEDDNGPSAAAAAAADDPGSEEEEKKRSDEEQPLLDSDNNQYPPKKNSGPTSEMKVESEVEPVVIADRQKSVLPSDGQADKPVSV